LKVLKLLDHYNMSLLRNTSQKVLKTRPDNAGQCA
jgi:hypothetical protein